MVWLIIFSENKKDEFQSKIFKKNIVVYNGNIFSSRDSEYLGRFSDMRCCHFFIRIVSKAKIL